MKSNTTYLKLFLICLPFVFSSCSKDDEGMSSAEKEEILTSNTWVIDDIVSHQSYEYNIMGMKESIDTTFSAIEGLQSCAYDIDYNFLISKIIQYTPAEDYCGEEIKGNFTWELSPSGNELTIVGDEGALFVTSSTGTYVKDDLVLQVLELNSTTLKCRLEVPFDEFISSYFGENAEIYEEMGIEISGGMTVDYIWVKKP